jgi:hopanoid biosynthesis associated RND transporter like protein HpnN
MRVTHATHRALLIFVLRVVARPRTTLLIGSIILVACAALAAWKLDISTDTNKLFDPHVAFFKEYLRFIALFPENEAIYVLIEARDPAHPPPTARWTSVADAIAQKLASDSEHVKSVDYRVPVDQLGSQGLLFDDPKLVQQSFEGVKRFIPLVKLWAEKPGALTQFLGRTPLERFITAVRTQKPDAETAGFVAMLAESWNYSLAHVDEPLAKGRGIPDLAALEATDPSRLGYYYVRDETDPSKHVMLIRVYHRTRYTSLTAISQTVESIRRGVREAAGAFPEFSVGVTGRPALEADEMRTTDTDSHRAEVIALIVVFIGLVVFLRSFWLALAGEMALGFGIGWTFGWATVSVGELNLLSIVFLLALIGIGMDYLVQVLTRYRQEFLRRPAHKNIWIGVFRHVAAPINTACMGAAGAFLVSTFTDFRGAAQLGIIAGLGLLLCLFAGYTVLPALLTIFPPRLKRDDHGDNGLPRSRAATGDRWNLLTPAIWLVLIIVGVPLLLRTEFNPNLIELQAPNLESVKLVRKLETWYAVVLSRDLQTLRAARQAVRGSPLVERTESILLAHDNLEWLRAREKEIQKIDWTEPKAVDADDLDRLSDKAAALAKYFASFEQAARQLQVFADELKVLRQKGDAETRRAAARLTAWQHDFILVLKDALAPFHPQPLDLVKLPPELKSHYIGTDGTFALYVYPTEDLWARPQLAAFVRDLETRIEPVPGERTLTGIALNVYHSTASIEKSFYKATAYALGLIFVLVLIDLRQIGQTLLAISVLAFGLPMLVAIMGWRGIDWNFANFFALPILIGAGHEYGVFMVHRYRETLRDPRRVWRRWDVADKALLLCAYVTCSSFGFFWAMGHHKGLKSLGLIMALGTACIYLAAIMVLRPLLLWRLARRGMQPKGKS